jgi:hypothetical protein
VEAPYLLRAALQPDEKTALHDRGPSTPQRDDFLAAFRFARACVYSGWIIPHAKVRLGSPIHLDGIGKWAGQCPSKAYDEGLERLNSRPRRESAATAKIPRRHY